MDKEDESHKVWSQVWEHHDGRNAVMESIMPRSTGTWWEKWKKEVRSRSRGSASTQGWRKPSGLLTLQIADAAQEQVLFSAYGASDGECDKMFCALQLITNLTKEEIKEICVQTNGCEQKSQDHGGVEAVHSSGYCKGAGHHGSVNKIQTSAASRGSRLR